MRSWAQMTLQLGIWFTLTGIFQSHTFSGQWWAFLLASMLIGFAFRSTLDILKPKEIA